MELRFEVAEDLSTVVGTEWIAFTPDLPVCEVVFRAWPNKPITAEFGNAMEITAMSIGGVPATPTVDGGSGEPGSPGTLYEVPLKACVEAGTTISAMIDFRLTLARGTDERIGRAEVGEMAWFGTAFPLLAWENGVGWAREPAVWVAGEMATSETFQLRSLEILAPARFEVLGAGEARGTETDAATGLTTHRFSAAAVRDVTVTVGELDTLDFEVVGARVHLGVPVIGARAGVDEWATEIRSALRRLEAYLGPVPYDDLWVTLVPDQSDGVEFPGAVQFGNVRPEEEEWLLSHEFAHLWFYGLVGNNQGRDPWLDESFATFVQLVVDDAARDPEPSEDYPPWLEGQMGQPMTYWAEQDRPTRSYVDGVYTAGGDALVEARRAVGAEAFDEALRDYLVENAHEVAAPSDVEAAFAELPGALAVLREAGAFVPVS